MIHSFICTTIKRNAQGALLLKACLCLFFFTLANVFSFQMTAFAQDDFNNPAGIDDIDIVITKEKQLELEKAQRTFRKMELLEQQAINTTQSFKLLDAEFDLPVIEPLVKPATMPLPPLTPLSNNYLKAGFGNFVSPYLEGFWNSTRHQRKNYGVHAKHFSSLNGPVDKENSGNSFNRIDAYGRFFVPSGEFYAEGGYERRGLHYYGYAPTEQPPSDSDIRQVYQLMQVAGGYKFYVPDRLFDFETKTHFYHFTDDREASETNIDLTGEGRYELNEVGKVQLKARVLLSQFEQGSVSSDRNVFALQPTYLRNEDRFHLEAGLKLVYSADTTGNAENVFLYPKIRANYEVLENVLTAYAGIEGDLDVVTFNRLSQENPFIGSSFYPINTSEQVRLSLGVRGKPSHKYGFRAGIAYSLLDNLYFFAPTPGNQSEYLIVSDPDFVGRFSFLADVSASFNKLHTALITRFDSYSSDNLEEAWHRSSFSGQLNAAYNFADKWYFSTELYFLQGIQAPALRADGSYRAEELDPIFDLNLKVEYRLKEKLTTFLDVKNLLSRAYERYIYYPVRGVQILAGGTYVF